MSTLLINQSAENSTDLNIFNREKDSLDFKSNDIYVKFVNDNVLFEQKELVTNHNKSIIGFMLGEIYDIDNSKYKLDIEYVISKYEKYGEEALKKLNGKYLIVIIDVNKKKTIIINDRYGHMVVYYIVENGKYIFCNKPNILLNFIKERKLNKNAIKQYLKYGMQLDDETLIKNIKKMNPATMVKIIKDDITFEKYWKWNYIHKNHNITYEEAVEKCGVLWIQAIGKILKKHKAFVLPLSGGLDSRAILAAIDYLGLNNKIYKTYTMNEEGKVCWDYSIAKKVAQIAGVKNDVWKYDADVCFENEEERIKNILGSPTFEIGQPYKYSQRILKYPLLDGLAGDAVIGGSFLNENILKNKDKYMKYYKHKLRASGIKNTQILKEKFQDDFFLPDEYKNNFCYDFFLYDTRVRNFVTAGVETIGDDFNTINPFFENELIDFVYSIPNEWKVNWKLYKDMLIKFFPKFYIDIPWQMTQKPIKELNIDKNSIMVLNHIEKINCKIKLKKSNKMLVLFGASQQGIKASNILKYYFKNIIFCDNDENKWGKLINHIEVISPNSLLELYKSKKIVVIISSMYDTEIAKQLKKLGIHKFCKFHIEANKMSFRDYNKYVCDKKEKIYEAFNKESYIIKEYFNKRELLELLDNHINHKIYNYRDILIVYNLIKFYEIYFDNIGEN